MTSYTSSFSTFNLNNIAGAASLQSYTTTPPMYISYNSLNAGNSNTSNYSILLNPVSAFKVVSIEDDLATLFSCNYPYGVYYAGDIGMYSDKIIPDRSSNRNHAIISGSGYSLSNIISNGSLNQIHTLFGTSSSIIRWGANSIPTNFTICSITTYTGATNNGILCSSGGSFIHGHNNGYVGYGNYYGTIKNNGSNVNIYNHTITCGNNSSPNNSSNFYVNNNPICVNAGGTVTTDNILTINGFAGKAGNFGFTYLIIWNKCLTDVQMRMVNNALTKFIYNNSLVCAPPLSIIGNNINIDTSTFLTSASLAGYATTATTNALTTTTNTLTTTTNALTTTTNTLTTTTNTLTTTTNALTTKTNTLTTTTNALTTAITNDSNNLRDNYTKTNDMNTAINNKAALYLPLAGGTLTGELKLPVNIWHRSSDDKIRIHYGNNGISYFGSQDGYTFLNKDNANIFRINDNGTITTGESTLGGLRINGGDANTLYSGNNNIGITFNSGKVFSVNSFSGNGTIISVNNTDVNIYQKLYAHKDIEIYGALIVGGNIMQNAVYASSAGNGVGLIMWGSGVGAVATIKDIARYESGIRSVAAVTAYYFVASSDKRIKKNIISINNKDYNNFYLIKPVKYNYIDCFHGIKKNYGFIANEIQNFFPNIIKKSSCIIPNIYEKASYINNIITFNNTSNIILKNNDKIKIVSMNDNNYSDYIITSNISLNSFCINSNLNHSNVFIYGTEVDDFLNIDYNQIFTLNVAATQELHKEVEILKNENEMLNNKLNKLLNKLNINLDDI